ncbi:hypothetical protein [Noviherbaspirillum sp. UKPF54]|uniref:Nmad2 family putative nucleotide modification protein n=1 Tax=Noviherbaspirillum sp. UKPF54 TaxID=2601898 RepID=UPI0011B14343|nr:hypothetical protein [Noviherbaspirillum sp. UKPF54]QDZ29577.1 hypothetical protein FAY22_17375 [Noviherbaspirillum sp. UKPF54]
MSRLIAYKMTHDTGFAPNPFGSQLTLATCKPAIRRTKLRGDWVAGFASQDLVHTSRRAGVSIPVSGLLYLMRVGEVLRLEDYFHDARYQHKKPLKGANDSILRCGDNIYDSDGAGGYRQLPNDSHDDSLSTIRHDTGGVNVLIADIFYYFGRNCPVPRGGWDSIGITLSKGRTFYCSESDLENIRRFLHDQRYEPGVHGKPCLWQEPEGCKAARSTCSSQTSNRGGSHEHSVPTCRY